MGRNTLDLITTDHILQADFRRAIIGVLYEAGYVGHNWWSDIELVNTLKKELDKRSEL